MDNITTIATIATMDTTISSNIMVITITKEGTIESIEKEVFFIIICEHIQSMNMNMIFDKILILNSFVV